MAGKPGPGARWQWVSLVLRDPPMPSRKPGYRGSVSIMGQTLGSVPLIPCPLLGLHGGWGAGSLNNIPLIMASYSISESLSTLVCQNMDTENTAENSHYDRWFVVQSVDSDHSISKLSPFILDNNTLELTGRGWRSFLMTSEREYNRVSFFLGQYHPPGIFNTIPPRLKTFAIFQL